MKRSAVNRKDTARTRSKKTLRQLRRVRRAATYTIVSNDGRVMRGRVLMRDGSLALIRFV